MSTLFNLPTTDSTVRSKETMYINTGILKTEVVVGFFYYPGKKLIVTNSFWINIQLHLKALSTYWQK